MRNIIRKLAVCFLAWILVCTTVVTGHGMHTAKAAQTFKIHFIDVGCADAALLQYGEGTEAKYALIDTGANQYHNTKDTTIDTTKTPVYEYLNKMGVKHLEFILLTHPHQDHIGGMEKILSDTSIQIDKIYGNDLNIQYEKSDKEKENEQTTETLKWTEVDSTVYKNLKKALENRNKLAEESENETEKEKLKVDYIVPTEGMTIAFGEAKMTFYGPITDANYQYGRVSLNTRQLNKYSIVTKIVYGNNSFLMTGDAQKETIEKIIAKGYDLTAQVLKEPHHGFQDVTEEELANGYQYSDHKTVIDASQASIAIISNGYMNTGGVPYTKVLRDLSKLDVYETGDRGTIIVTSDGSQLSIQTEKGDNQPSVKGKESDDETSSPVMKSMNITANTTKPLTATSVDAANTYDRYEKKNITVRFSGAAQGFTKLTSIEYKFVPKGVNNKTIAYKTGSSYTVKNGNCGRFYVRYNTPLGSTEIKLPGFTVDTKAPTSVKIKANKSGIKTRSTSSKNIYSKRIKKSVKFTFSANYGTSGKFMTQYKFVPRGKKASKYKWKTANSVTYKKRNKKVRLYVRYIDKSGNITTKKTNGFYVTKK